MDTNKNERLYQIKIVQNDVIRSIEGAVEYGSSSDDEELYNIYDNVAHVPNVADNEMINIRYNLRPRPT